MVIVRVHLIKKISDQPTSKAVCYLYRFKHLKKMTIYFDLIKSTRKYYIKLCDMYKIRHNF